MERPSWMKEGDTHEGVRRDTQKKEKGGELVVVKAWKKHRGARIHISPFLRRPYLDKTVNAIRKRLRLFQREARSEQTGVV